MKHPIDETGKLAIRRSPRQGIFLLIVCLTLLFESSATADRTTQISAAFNWAEMSFPDLLSPSNTETQYEGEWVFRDYTDTGIHIEVDSSDQIFVEGGLLGDRQYYGQLDSVLTEPTGLVDGSWMSRAVRWSESRYSFLDDDGQVISFAKVGDDYHRYTIMDGYWSYEQDSNKFRIDFTDGDFWEFDVFVRGQQIYLQLSDSLVLGPDADVFSSIVSADDNLIAAAAEENAYPLVKFTESLIVGTWSFDPSMEGMPNGSQLEFTHNGYVLDLNASALEVFGQNFEWEIKAGTLYMHFGILGILLDTVVFLNPTSLGNDCYEVTGNSQIVGNWMRTFTMCKQ